MVTKPHYKEIQGPPPVDESWWEAVLAEDEAQGVSSTAKAPEKSLSARTVLARRPPGGSDGHYQGESGSMNWTLANSLYEQDQTICLQVTGYNRGGLLVSGEGLQGFVPISHLVDMPGEDADPEKWLERYLGHSLTLKVIECDQDRGRVVFSERAALAEPGSRNNLLSRLRPGDRVCGTVTNITDFGVFVDLGGVEGLIHVSEISWGRVHHPADVVCLGKQVDVHVINVDRERARVGLSMKRLYPNPWETAQARYFPGQITEAVITSIVQFGAFARLEEGLDGLIHVSEMSSDAEEVNPADMLHEGQRVQVRVLHVDGTRQRLGLSLHITDTLPTA